MPHTATDSNDEAVNWQAAEAFLTGKGAAEQPDDVETPESAAPPKTEPELVEVSIRGRKVKMSPEDAEAYREFVRETRERDGRLGGELQQLKERVARAEGLAEASVRAKAPTDELQPPDIKLAEEDFAEYHRQMVRYTDQRVARAQAEALDRQEQAERARAARAEADARASRWTREFFERYEHLNNDESRVIANAVYQKHAREIDEMVNAGDFQGSQDRLAELVDAHVVAVRSRSKQANANKPPRVEGAGTPARRTAPTVEPDRELSAAEWVRRKRAAMRGESKK